jgi:hypothetical protein
LIPRVAAHRDTRPTAGLAENLTAEKEQRGKSMAEKSEGVRSLLFVSVIMFLMPYFIYLCSLAYVTVLKNI